MTRFYKSLLFIFVLFIAGCNQDSNDADGGINRTANLRGLGDSARELLSDDEFTSMHLEIVYVDGYQPEASAIAGFKQFLEQRTYKPDGINISMRAASSSGKAPFSIQEIADIEKEERTIYNAGDEIAVYIYFADGSNEDDENNKFVLGSAFRNTSIVIYGETVKKFAARAGAPSKSDIEEAVLNHEFGHLFGLVDLGTEAQSDHVDSDNRGHCTTSGCLMQASIEFGSGIIDEIEAGRVPSLGDACILDLQANGGR